MSMKCIKGEEDINCSWKDCIEQSTKVISVRNTPVKAETYICDNCLELFKQWLKDNGKSIEYFIVEPRENGIFYQQQLEKSKKEKS